ncbi:hypothetical protein HCH52_05085 [Oscillospiraceae bacterium HV4-5-C5C]|nr:hypothetical protein [Oscillospiraceae bacterium HV4-5-C5C]
MQTKYKTDTEGLTEKLHAQRLDSALDAAITAAHGKNPKAIKALLNREGLKLKDDGTVDGLGLKGIQKSYPYLFGDCKPEIKGANPADGSDGVTGKGATGMEAQINAMLGL